MFFAGGKEQNAVDAGARALDHLGPARVLRRGYSITTLEGSSSPLKDATRVHGGQTLITRLARGEVRSLVSGAATEPRGPRLEPVAQPSLFDEGSAPATETTPSNGSDP